MKRLFSAPLGVVAAAMLLVAGPALAQDAAAKIKQALEPKINAKIDSVTKTPYLGLYEVRIGSDIVYTDENATYVFVGDIRDGNTLANLTEERKAELSAIDFKSLPLAHAIKTVRGNGSRTLAVFADPNCSFCRRFDQQLASMENVTIYTFLYPILSPDSMEKSKLIWCAKDRSKAYFELMLKGVQPNGPANCDTSVIEKNVALGRKLGIDGTPTSFLPTGQRIVGARPEMVVRGLEKGPAK